MSFSQKHYPNGLNFTFERNSKEELKNAFTGKGGKFEDPELREVAAIKSDLLKSLGSLKTLRVADVGAGSGLFLESFSVAVGNEGTVYAIDISPGFVEHLRDTVAAKQLGNVQVLQSQAKSTGLSPASVDLAFVCDVYHHFLYPKATLASIRSALDEDGRLVVVDFHRDPELVTDHSAEWAVEHIRAGKAVFRHEIESAGFRLVCDIKVTGASGNYCMVFEKNTEAFVC